MTKSKLITIVLLFVFCFNGFANPKDRILKNPFFVFNNGLNNQGLPFIPYKEQASLLKKYGFYGIEHRETSGIIEFKDAFDILGMKMYANYVKIDIDQKEPYLSEWKQVIPRLKLKN